ncbi:MAG: hypothetical protein IT210_21150 [Armatimonadetes bacterium]|nr:hypothetical protein [Armatimonadota bacterium]
MRRFPILFILLLIIPPASARKSGGAVSPAGERLVKIDRAPGAVSVLPTGRLLTPYGKQIVVPPHPYGLALSPDGRTLIASSNGTGPFALTVITGLDTAEPAVHTISEAEDAELKSLYQGIAVSPDSRTLYASGGNDRSLHIFDLATRRRQAKILLDGDGYEESLPGQMALSPDGRILLIVDQANYRLVVFDTAKRKVAASVKTGRAPFAVAFSPDGRAAYVANIGLFEYRPVEKAEGKDARGLPFPPFGYPSRQAREGTVIDGRRVPGLGPANVPEAYSVWAFDVSSPSSPRLSFRVSTGVPVSYTEEEEEIEDKTVGGSAPCALAVSDRFVYVSNANNDTVQAIARSAGRIAGSVRLSGLLPRPLRPLRGMTPYGLALSPGGGRLYAALAGFNAVAIIDTARLRPLGMIPAGWYAAQVALSPDGGRLYVANAKGFGSGPNAGKDFARGPEGTSIGRLMKGSVSIMQTPQDKDLAALTRRVLANNGALAAPPKPQGLPPIRHILFITKENRTFDEVFGALPGVRGDASLSRYGVPQKVEGVEGGEAVIAMPNHIALARRFAISDNFYVDSDHSADGHRWLAGVPPNHWAESVVSAAYGGQMSDNPGSTAPGRRILFGSNSSVMPEDYLEAGTLWHHLARHSISFRNWGEGFEFAGIDEGPGLKPTGSRLPLNIPMPQPLFKNTSRNYPGFNMNIPDQYRADVFLREFRERYESGQEPLPRFMYIHLPNDHGAGPRPQDGYPAVASYMADNDLALARIVEHLSGSRFWKDFAIFVTEDDAQSGVDSVDAHRSLLMVASPWVKPGYASRRHADISAIQHAIYDLLGLPNLSLYDALASDLSDLWTDQPDLSPYAALPVDTRLFDPARAKDPLDPDYRSARLRPSGPVDDPDEIERLRRLDGLD